MNGLGGVFVRVCLCACVCVCVLSPFLLFPSLLFFFLLLPFEFPVLLFSFVWLTNKKRGGIPTHLTLQKHLQHNFPNQCKYVKGDLDAASVLEEDLASFQIQVLDSYWI